MGLMVFGIQIYSQKDRPYIHQILSKQGKTEHQTAGCDRMAIHLHSQEIDGSDGGQGKKARVDERRSDPPDEEIIGDQEIRLFYDPPVRG